MKTLYGAVPLAAAALLAGCAGFWNPLPTTSTTTTTSNTADSSGYFYVLDEGTTPQLAGFYVSSGTLDQISGTPINLGSKPYSIAIAPGGGFLYVGTSGGIYLYTIGSGGVLTGGTVISHDVAAAMQVSSSGLSTGSSWLIDAYLTSTSGASVTVNAYEIDSSTGALEGTKGTQPPYSVSGASMSMNQMVLSPKDDYLFLALGTAGTIVAPFTASQSNPLPSPSNAQVIQPAISGGGALSVAVDPSERVFYIGETDAVSGSGGLRVFDYPTSPSQTSFSQAGGSPLPSGNLSPNAILPEASGTYVYVANGDGELDGDNGTINEFTISCSGTDCTIASGGSSVTAGIEPMGLAEDSSDQFILAVSDGGTNTIDSNGDGDPDLEGFTLSAGAPTSSSPAIESASGNNEPAIAHAIVAQPAQ